MSVAVGFRFTEMVVKWSLTWLRGVDYLHRDAGSLVLHRCHCTWSVVVPSIFLQLNRGRRQADGTRHVTDKDREGENETMT